MARLKKNEIISLMREWEDEYGEDCTEYVGYGYGRVFSKWLVDVGYIFTGSICIKTVEELSDNIIAYRDVICAFSNDEENEELYNILKQEILPEYLANYASNEEYLIAILYFAIRLCDYNENYDFIEEKFEERIGKTLRTFI